MQSGVWLGCSQSIYKLGVGTGQPIAHRTVISKVACSCPSALFLPQCSPLPVYVHHRRSLTHFLVNVCIQWPADIGQPFKAWDTAREKDTELPVVPEFWPREDVWDSQVVYNLKRQEMNSIYDSLRSHRIAELVRPLAAVARVLLFAVCLTAVLLTAVASMSHESHCMKASMKASLQCSCELL